MGCLRSQAIFPGPALKKSYPDLTFLTPLNRYDIVQALAMHYAFTSLQYDALLIEAIVFQVRRVVLLEPMSKDVSGSNSGVISLFT
jgi:hypothetical protein